MQDMKLTPNAAPPLPLPRATARSKQGKNSGTLLQLGEIPLDSSQGCRVRNYAPPNRKNDVITRTEDDDAERRPNDDERRASQLVSLKLTLP